MKPLESPPSKVTFVQNGINSSAWYNWFSSVYRRLAPTNIVTGYPKAHLTAVNKLSPADGASSDHTSLIYVPDATGGAALAYSDGAHWISMKTGAPV